MSRYVKGLKEESKLFYREYMRTLKKKKKEKGDKT